MAFLLGTKMLLHKEKYLRKQRLSYFLDGYFLNNMSEKVTFEQGLKLQRCYFIIFTYFTQRGDYTWLTIMNKSTHFVLLPQAETEL